MESGKGVKDEDDAHIEIDYDKYNEDTENSNNIHDETSKSDSDDESNEEDNEQDNESDGESTNDDDPYKNISLKEDKGEYQATTKSGRKVFAPKRIHYEDNTESHDEADDETGGTLDGLKSKPSLEGEVREHTKRIKPVRRHSQQLKPIITQYSVNKMIMKRKRKQCMR